MKPLPSPPRRPPKAILAVWGGARAHRRACSPSRTSFLPTIAVVTQLHLQLPHLNLDLQPELGTKSALSLVDSAEIIFSKTINRLPQLHPHRSIATPQAPTTSLITGPLQWLLRMSTPRYAYCLSGDKPFGYAS